MVCAQNMTPIPAKDYPPTHTRSQRIIGIKLDELPTGIPQGDPTSILTTPIIGSYMFLHVFTKYNAFAVPFAFLGEAFRCKLEMSGRARPIDAEQSVDRWVAADLESTETSD